MGRGVDGSAGGSERAPEGGAMIRPLRRAHARMAPWWWTLPILVGVAMLRRVLQ